MYETLPFPTKYKKINEVYYTVIDTIGDSICIPEQQKTITAHKIGLFELSY